MSSVPRPLTGRAAALPEPRVHHTNWEKCDLLEADFDDMPGGELAYRRWREKLQTKLEREQ